MRSTTLLIRLRSILVISLLTILLAACNPPYTPAAKESIATPTAEEPAVAINLPMTTLNGQTLNLADYQGQIVLVNFWATWCAPCRIEMPDLDAYYQAHRDDGFMLLAVNNSEAIGRVEEFIAQNDFSFTIVLDEEGDIADYFGGIRAMPTSFLLNEEGEVVQQFFGAIEPELLETAVTPLLEERGEEGG